MEKLIHFDFQNLSEKMGRNDRRRQRLLERKVFKNYGDWTYEVRLPWFLNESSEKLQECFDLGVAVGKKVIERVK